MTDCPCFTYLPKKFTGGNY